MSLPAYEKMGAFYLGRRVKDAAGTPTDETILYDAKDLTTHAMCVGMTGSGKTGLCIGLLEEAAMDGVPAIAIDPKGDLGNLLLTFPDLRPEDFAPWVEEAQAARKGLTVPQYAASVATQWREGLASWGQDGDRIRRLKEAADFAIYTPGSSAGRPLTILRSFAAPPPAVRDDADALRDRVGASVAGLLGLVGVDADPLRSREHILLANLVERAWREGEDLDLGTLILKIQDPGFTRVGVMDLESFFPAKDRFGLAMTLNNLLASPGFASWIEGEPLDVQRLLYTPEGKPRIAIISIAHLSDAERMFFVTLLLNEVVSWMRSQSGSTSLRALLYMDEIFGYLPPSANPPSKTPMLTLLKQARAFGLGVVLATQNPVDLDYKALSNMGTWFLGRLQTERDKLRILDGLEGATASADRPFDRAKLEATLSGLAGRVFLMNNVHDAEPVLFQTRWVMSYLKGPLTRAEIKRLDAKAPAPAAAPAPEALPKADRKEAARPVLPPDVPERFVRPSDAGVDDGAFVYRPVLLGRARVHFVDTRRDVDVWQDRVHVAKLGGTRVPADPWEGSDVVADLPAFAPQPSSNASYARLPSQATDAKAYRAWTKDLKEHAYRDATLSRWRCESLKAWSDAGEAEGDFRARLRQLLREQRDLEIEKLKQSYGAKVERLEERLRKAEQRLEKEEAQYEESKRGSWLKIGETILGAVLGRKRVTSGTIGKAQTAARGMGRSRKEKLDVEQAEEDVSNVKEEMEALEAAFTQDLEDVRKRLDEDKLDITDASLKPRKSDIEIEDVVLAWTPWRVAEDGTAEAAYLTRPFA
ncbi:MAG: ATP-binding protein [Planctomycetes bacterium]|nr:ATP-binding protein [Planctomycetota bacterium]MCB9901931.1 ATP-binding protein [Planctomycetota bacterium]